MRDTLLRLWARRYILLRALINSLSGWASMTSAYLNRHDLPIVLTAFMVVLSLALFGLGGVNMKQEWPNIRARYWHTLPESLVAHQSLVDYRKIIRAIAKPLGIAFRIRYNEWGDGYEVGFACENDLMRVVLSLP